MHAIGPGMRVLDLGCGTGDLLLGAAKKIGTRGEIIGLDFSEKMIEMARQRVRQKGLDQGGPVIRFENRPAQDIPFEAAPYDRVISGFVLRNIYENIDEILQGVQESLKKGGQIRFLDFTEPPGKIRRALWRVYMNTVAAFYGKILFGKDFPAQYMTDSARRFAKAPEFEEKLRRAGFVNVSSQKFMMGIIVLYRGQKP